MHPMPHPTFAGPWQVRQKLWVNINAHSGAEVLKPPVHWADVGEDSPFEVPLRFFFKFRRKMAQSVTILGAN